jgi:acyl-CoA thioester hydrolase
MTAVSTPKPDREAVARQTPSQRTDFPWFLDLQTRWGDNDAYGHMNNVIYYALFDTLVNRFLIDEGGFDLHASPIIGITPETSCRFYRSFAYPEKIQGGLRIGRLGTSSVQYEIGLFGRDDTSARADGRFVHVFVDRASQRPAPIPPRIRAAFERIKV